MTEDLQSWLREVQRRGWRIVAPDEETCVVACDSPTCGLRVKLRQGGTIPPRLTRKDDSGAVVVSSFDGARMALRDRREQLLLTIAEVEDIAGLSSDHLAKAEKDNPDRIINVDLFLHWAGALGFRVVLVPDDLPPITLRTIAQTRRHQVRRRRHVEVARDARLPR